MKRGVFGCHEENEELAIENERSRLRPRTREGTAYGQECKEAFAAKNERGHCDQVKGGVCGKGERGWVVGDTIRVREGKTKGSGRGYGSNRGRMYLMRTTGLCYYCTIFRLWTVMIPFRDGPLLLPLMASIVFNINIGQRFLAEQQRLSGLSLFFATANRYVYELCNIPKRLVLALTRRCRCFSQHRTEQLVHHYAISSYIPAVHTSLPCVSILRTISMVVCRTL